MVRALFLLGLRRSQHYLRRLRFNLRRSPKAILSLAVVVYALRQ